MKVQGILYTDKNKKQEILISRSRHDFHYSTDGKVYVDGGRDYLKFGGDVKNCRPIWIDYIGVTHADLYNDWNSRKDKLGIIKYPSKKIKILEQKDYPDIESFDWKKESLIWGTYGKNGDEPLKYIHLVDAETDHLQTILNTQKHIYGETKQIIQSILEDRK